MSESILCDEMEVHGSDALRTFPLNRIAFHSYFNAPVLWHITGFTGGIKLLGIMNGHKKKSKTEQKRPVFLEYTFNMGPEYTHQKIFQDSPFN